jgi:hypothetical protein
MDAWRGWSRLMPKHLRRVHPLTVCSTYLTFIDPNSTIYGSSRKGNDEASNPPWQKLRLELRYIAAPGFLP